MTAPASDPAHAALFAAAREFLAAPDGDCTRAERFLAHPRRGCACAHETVPCRACRSVIALAAEALTRIPAPRQPSPIETIAVVPAPTRPGVWAAQARRQARTRHGVAS